MPDCLRVLCTWPSIAPSPHSTKTHKQNIINTKHKKDAEATIIIIKTIATIRIMIAQRERKKQLFIIIKSWIFSQEWCYGRESLPSSFFRRAAPARQAKKIGTMNNVLIVVILCAMRQVIRTSQFSYYSSSN